MTRKYRPQSILNKGQLLTICLVVFGVLAIQDGWAAYQDLDFTGTCHPPSDPRIYHIKKTSGDVRFSSDSADPLHYMGIKAITSGPPVRWTVGIHSTDCHPGTNPTNGYRLTCSGTDNLGQPGAGVSIDVPPITATTTNPQGSPQPTSIEAILHPNDIDGTGSLQIGSSYFYLSVTTQEASPKTCEQKYIFNVDSSGGGWGDPHITTVDGVKYDFQSAGEFVALRGNGVEVQTRQTPVPTSYIPGPNDGNQYTGVISCVSVYTAVALKVGTHRVTIQPNIAGVPDPSGLQLRVDGVLKTLGPEGIDLTACDCSTEKASKGIKHSGRIQWAADEKSYEILYDNGTKVVVTPDYWDSQKKWYLNVNVNDTTATQGIMGKIATGSWLPALSNGTSLGAKPSSLHDRYVQLYQTFADSWRVTDTTSLFDYAQGTKTANFTDTSWPRESPTSCLIQDGTVANPIVANPVDVKVAKAACSSVTDPDNRANCEFDVRVTGYTGFADTYKRSEEIIPGATRTTLTADENPSKPGSKVTFTASVSRAVSTIGKITSGRIQFMLDGKKAGNPLAFDGKGNAKWSTSALTKGKHEIEAGYIPSPFGEQFRASSAKISQTVSTTTTTPHPPKWWIWIVIIIVLILLFLWLKSRSKSST